FSLYSLQHGDQKSAQRLDRVLAEGLALANTLKSTWPELAPAWLCPRCLRFGRRKEFGRWVAPGV
ncbi:MAG: hypothetical protein LR011_10295, partial [Verrucomicrobia bacterium]|nr:hypothetical protein [Verrucomicrobiota bacterium]